MFVLIMIAGLCDMWTCWRTRLHCLQKKFSKIITTRITTLIIPGTEKKWCNPKYIPDFIQTGGKHEELICVLIEIRLPYFNTILVFKPLFFHFLKLLEAFFVDRTIIYIPNLSKKYRLYKEEYIASVKLVFFRGQWVKTPTQACLLAYLF